MLKQTHLRDVPVGKNFNVWGHNFTVLKKEEGRIIVLSTELVKEMPFREYHENAKTYKVAPNDFRDSDIKAYLNGEFIDELVGAGADRNEDILPLTIDLKCTLGQHEYGSDTVDAGLLTLEQYGEFYDIIPLIEDWWWLATPWRTPSRSPDTYDADGVFGVVSDGGYRGISYDGSCGVRPALNLNPFLLVSWEDEQEQIGDADEKRGNWDGYIKYLHWWAVTHSEKQFEGCMPACYDEWLDCEGKEEE